MCGIMQKYTTGYIFPKNHMQNYTRGIISHVGMFSTVTPEPESTANLSPYNKHCGTYYFLPVVAFSFFCKG